MAAKSAGPIYVESDGSTSNELLLVGQAIEGGHKHGPGIGRSAWVLRALFPDCNKDDEYWTARVFLDEAWRDDEEKNLMAMLLYLASEVIGNQCLCCGRDYE